MPSIIEKIQLTEAEALALKKEAITAGREAVAAAVQSSQSNVRTAREAARDSYQAALMEAEKEGALLAESITKENNEKADEYCRGCEKNVARAVDYILERAVKA